MKVPPKRKGNYRFYWSHEEEHAASMKVPPKRKGNWIVWREANGFSLGLNESPSQKEGKFGG